MKAEIAPTERKIRTLDRDPMSWNTTAQMMITPMTIQMFKNVVRMRRSARAVSCFMIPLMHPAHRRRWRGGRV